MKVSTKAHVQKKKKTSSKSPILIVYNNDLKNSNLKKPKNQYKHKYGTEATWVKYNRNQRTVWRL
jgi:hypothetical protein